MAPDGRRLTSLDGFVGPESVLRVARYVATGAYEVVDFDTWLSRNPDR
jgi:thioredoxin-related protein